MNEQILKIAVDVRPLSHDLTGIGRYTYNVLHCLINQYPNVHWYLYSDRPMLTELSYKNVTIRIAGKGHKLASTLVSQIIFPIWIRKDKVHTFWSPRHHLPIFLAFLSKVKKVVTIHDLVWKKHPSTMSRYGLLLEKLLFLPSIKLADTIISVSNFTQQELSTTYPSVSTKIITTQLQSFISKEEMERYRPNIIETSYILFVGTLEPRKNLKNLLLAFKNILTNNKDMKLIIAGKDGWGSMNISDYVNQLNIEKNVEITGFIPNDTLLSLYQHCDILVMPSLYEGFGLPALEALSLKKKVVVSKFNAIAELSGDNIFITNLDEESIYQTLLKAMKTNPKQFANVGNDWNKVARQTFQALI